MWRMIFRNQDLQRACCYWGIIASRPSQWTEVENVCFCVHIDLCVYHYFDISLCIHFKSVSPLLAFNYNPALQCSFQPFPCHFSDREKPAFHYPLCIYIFVQFFNALSISNFSIIIASSLSAQPPSLLP